MFCAFLGHTGERLQDHWSSGYNMTLHFSEAKTTGNRKHIITFDLRLSLSFRMMGVFFPIEIEVINRTI